VFTQRRHGPGADRMTAGSPAWTRPAPTTHSRPLCSGWRAIKLGHVHLAQWIPTDNSPVQPDGHGQQCHVTARAIAADVRRTAATVDESPQA